ncbi:MAG: YtrH family sporulation protein [Bacillota bacterium]
MHGDVRPALYQVVTALFLALGVVIGGSLFGGLSALFTGRPPIATIQELARTIKLWAIVAAIGGSFPTIQAIETGLLAGQPGALARQVAIILAGLLGAQLGQWLVAGLTGE